MKTKLLLLVLTLLLFACDNESGEPLLVDTTLGIDLRSMNDGDRSAYILYRSSCDGGFSYTGDTLMVTIEERNDSTFLKEEYSGGSTLESMVEHLIIKKEGYVLVPQRFQSNFLFFYGNDTIFLDRVPEVELKQVGCRLFHQNEEFIGDFIGSVDRFQFGDVMIEDSRGVSCVPTIFDLDAYILYSNHLNMVHVIQDSGEEQNIFGFVAIQ